MQGPSIETAHVDVQSEEWFASYLEPPSQSPRYSSNRRRNIRHRRGRDLRRRQYRFQTAMMVLSVALVGAMTACFYVVLTR